MGPRVVAAFLLSILLLGLGAFAVTLPAGGPPSGPLMALLVVLTALALLAGAHAARPRA